MKPSEVLRAARAKIEKADKFLSYVAALDAARDALREKLESEGDEGCVLAAEDSRALEVGEGLRE